MLMIFLFRGERALFNMVEICLNPDSEIVGMFICDMPYYHLGNFEEGTYSGIGT